LVQKHLGLNLGYNPNFTRLRLAAARRPRDKPPLMASWGLNGEIFMTKIALALALSLAVTAGAQTAQAGCVTGAVVGGVAGHVAGHHAVLGAAAGCAVGHHMAVEKKRRARAARAASYHPH
jgi:hypothetical protein